MIAVLFQISGTDIYFFMIADENSSPAFGWLLACSDNQEGAMIIET